jgi:hypothetical protein
MATQNKVDFILDNILQPKLNECYNQMVKHKNETKLKKEIANLIKIAKSYDLDIYYTKEKMFQIIKTKIETEEIDNLASNFNSTIIIK